MEELAKASEDDPVFDERFYHTVSMLKNPTFEIEKLFSIPIRGFKDVAFSRYDKYFAGYGNNGFTIYEIDYKDKNISVKNCIPTACFQSIERYAHRNVSTNELVFLSTGITDGTLEAIWYDRKTNEFGESKVFGGIKTPRVKYDPNTRNLAFIDRDFENNQLVSYLALYEEDSGKMHSFWPRKKNKIGPDATSFAHVENYRYVIGQKDSVVIFDAFAGEQARDDSTPNVKDVACFGNKCVAAFDRQCNLYNVGRDIHGMPGALRFKDPVVAVDFSRLGDYLLIATEGEIIFNKVVEKKNE